MRTLAKICLAVVLAVPLVITAADKPRKDRIRVPVWTLPGGPKLTSRALHAKIEGEPVKVLRVRGPSDDLVILLVLDLTGDLTQIDLARQALAAELEALPPNAHVALLRAQDGLRVLNDPTGDRKVVAETIASVSPSGKSGLLETAAPALGIADSLLDKASLRAAVLFVTDSNIYNYREDYTNPVINSSDSRDLSRRFPEGLIRERSAQLSAELSRTETPLFIVHLDYRRDRLNEAYQTGLLEITQSTGGQALFCRSQPEIASAIGLAMQSIRELYRVDVQLPGNASRAVQVQLSTEGSGLRHRERFVIR